MSDSQAIALLADPTKVDISSPPAIESGTNERPIETALAPVPSTPKADNVLDLLEELWKEMDYLTGKLWKSESCKTN